ncbi:MAG TPA: PAS domain-containing protein, partial [Flavisolibacter sp.]|nr:PAS domain-containing protein [Flavisolibacter sp.]
MKKEEGQISKEELLLTYIKKIPGMAWVIDENINLVYANNEFYRFLNLQENELNTDISGKIPKYILDALYLKHISRLKAGKPVETVEKIKLPGKELIYFHITIFPLEAFNGQKLVGGHAVKINKDNSTPEELRNAKKRLLNLTQFTSDAIWELDISTGEVFRNDVLLKLFGYEKENNQRLSWWLNRIHPDDLSGMQDIIDFASESKQGTWEYEYRFQCADGSYKHV